MASFFRNFVRAGPSRPTSLFSRHFAAPTLPAYQSAVPSETASTTDAPRSETHGPSSYPKRLYGLESAAPNPLTEPFTIPEEANIKMPGDPAFPTVYDESDAWWAHQSRQSKSVLPGNQWSGRSIRVFSGDTMKAYRSLSGLLSRSGVKKFVKRGEFHEKPSERKRRLGTERHRRRFQEMVREKVQTVQMIRNRG